MVVLECATRGKWRGNRRSVNLVVTRDLLLWIDAGDTGILPQAVRSRCCWCCIQRGPFYHVNVASIEC